MASKPKTKQIADAVCTEKEGRWVWAYGKNTYAWNGRILEECREGSDLWTPIAVVAELKPAVWFTFGIYMAETAARKKEKGVQAELFDLPLPPDSDSNV